MRTNEKGISLGRLLVLALLCGGLLTLSVFLGQEPAWAADADSDGLSDDLEATLGTDSNDADSDDDSWTDFDEVFFYGTDPNLADTDGDGTDDPTDPNPLENGNGWNGVSTPSRDFDSNLKRAALSGATPFEGYRVNALTGQLETRLATLDFGPGTRGQNRMTLTYLSGIEQNGRWGRNVVCNWDWWIVEQEDDDVEVYMFGGKYLVNESSGAYTSPAGFPFTVTKDAPADEITVTAIRGGKQWVFDATDGWLTEIEDRFGNTTEIYRIDGLIETVTLPEGNEIEFVVNQTDRYQDINDWAGTQRT